MAQVIDHDTEKMVLKVSLVAEFSLSLKKYVFIVSEMNKTPTTVSFIFSPSAMKRQPEEDVIDTGFYKKNECQRRESQPARRTSSNT